MSGVHDHYKYLAFPDSGADLHMRLSGNPFFFGENIVDSSWMGWDHGLNWPVSLLDMTLYCVKGLYALLEYINKWAATVRSEVLRGRNLGSTLLPPETEAFSQILLCVGKQCRSLDIIHGEQRVDHIAKRQSVFTLGEFRTEILGLREMLEDELDSRTFCYIPKDRSSYMTAIPGFGMDVYKGFRTARRDIRGAFRCIAADAGTAAVFHLMRVAECGVKALIKDRRIHFGDGRSVEFQTWKAILLELNRSLKAIEDWEKTRIQQRDQALEFYGELVLEFTAFKGTWRDRTMHSRAHYGTQVALGACEHVRRFMQLLVTRITETERTPKIWTKAQVV